MKITDSYKHPCLDVGILEYTTLFSGLADKKYYSFSLLHVCKFNPSSELWPLKLVTLAHPSEWSQAVSKAGQKIQVFFFIERKNKALWDKKKILLSKVSLVNAAKVVPPSLRGEKLRCQF